VSRSIGIRAGSQVRIYHVHRFQPASRGARIVHFPIEYDFAGSGISPYREDERFVLEIHRLGRERGILEHDCRIDTLQTDQPPTKTKRTAYSGLSKEKIATAFGIQTPDWKKSLRAFFAAAISPG